MHAITVRAEPDPIQIARGLADRPQLSVLWDATGRGASYVACDADDMAVALDPEAGLNNNRELGELGKVPRWIGALPYEAMRTLERPRQAAGPERRESPHLVEPVWWRYPAVIEVTDRVRVAGDREAAVRSLAAKVQNRDVAASFRLGFAEPPEPAQEHLQRVSRALELIRQGDIYQVNLARRFRLRFEGHSVDLLERLGRLTGAPFSALLGLGEVEMVSSSPELFIEMRPDGGVVTSPIKGTRARGSDARKDGELAEELERDPKERAELVMVIDVERNDLGKVCRPGSVRLLHPPRVETFATLHHRLASIGGELRPEVTRGQLLAAMLPSGSVTGAPKIRAMEVIAELEAHRRGLYTGAFGAVAHDGGMRLAMAIRTLTLRGAEAHYFSGGGIVADSDPRREVLETEWKASHIRALLAAGG